jgi:hypothetical protein
MSFRKLFLSTLSLGLFVGLFSLSSAPVSAQEYAEGTRLPNYESELRRVYPSATRFEEYSFVPHQWGGISLMGLIGRLVGDRAHAPFESINTRRYIYRAYKGDEVLGVSHGSSILAKNDPMDLFVFYSPDSSIKDVRLDRAPSSVLTQLHEGGYLQQFLNRPAEDFTVTIGRRGRVTNWGTFAKEARRPREKELSTYFDRIVRSMRFNAAFVEIAYFIGQHPQGTQTASASETISR